MQWFAVHTQPRMEGRALLNLQRQGFQVYLPRYLKRRAHARRVDRVASPLFPRYLFVAIDLTWQGWRAIRSTFGVTDIVRHGDLPTAIPDQVIAAIRAREDASGLVEVGLVPGVRPGARVEIVDGAFMGTRAIFECVSDEQRVTLLMELLGRPVRIQLPAGAIAAA